MVKEDESGKILVQNTQKKRQENIGMYQKKI